MVLWVLELTKIRDPSPSGIGHYKVFYPNKHSIYFENVPQRFVVQLRDTIDRYQQLSQYLQEQGSAVWILDVRPALLGKHTAQQPTYRKVESHWNA